MIPEENNNNNKKVSVHRRLRNQPNAAILLRSALSLYGCPLWLSNLRVSHVFSNPMTLHGRIFQTPRLCAMTLGNRHLVRLFFPTTRGCVCRCCANKDVAICGQPHFPSGCEIWHHTLPKWPPVRSCGLGHNGSRRRTSRTSTDKRADPGGKRRDRRSRHGSSRYRWGRGRGLVRPAVMGLSGCLHAGVLTSAWCR